MRAATLGPGTVVTILRRIGEREFHEFGFGDHVPPILSARGQDHWLLRMLAILDFVGRIVHAHAFGHSLGHQLALERR